jgi:hypothetical protein
VGVQLPLASSMGVGVLQTSNLRMEGGWKDQWEVPGGGPRTLRPEVLLP